MSTDVRPSGRLQTTLGRVHASEWIKFTGLRSSLGLVIAGVLAPPLVTWGAVSADPTTPTVEGVLNQLVFANLLFPIVTSLIGVLSVTTEYTQHSSAVTFLSVPQRWRVVLAKASLVAEVTAVVTALAIAASIVVATVGGHAPRMLGSQHVWTIAAGTVLYAVAVGLIGFGAGLLVRSTLAAVGTVIGFLYALPVLLEYLPLPGTGWLASTLPSAAVKSLEFVDPEVGALPPAAAVVALIVWALIWVVGGAVVVTRRNA